MNPTFKKKGVVVLGVSKDSIPTHDKFAEKYKLPYVLLSGSNAEVVKKYGAFGSSLALDRFAYWQTAEKCSSLN